MENARVVRGDANSVGAGETSMNLDIGGYVLSSEFLSQLAALVAAVLNLALQSVFGSALGN